MTMPDDAYEWLPVRDAADRLHTSASTVLRMIREGSLVAELGPRSERDRRPQYLVRFDRPQDTPMSTPEATTPRQDAPDVANAIRAAIDPYVAMNERIAELYAGAVAENAELRERVGRAEADASHAQAHADAAITEAAELRRQLGRRRWWWPFS
jgi:hypothetical protein